MDTHTRRCKVLPELLDGHGYIAISPPYTWGGKGLTTFLRYPSKQKTKIDPAVCQFSVHVQRGENIVTFNSIEVCISYLRCQPILKKFEDWTSY